MTLRFESCVHGATLALVIPADEGDAVHAALQLARHEALCAALESWLGAPLDPAPARPTPQALHWAETEAGVRIGLAWPLLEHASRAPPLLLAWDDLVFDVELAAFGFDPMPEGVTQGILLLPEAFSLPWRVTLRSRSHGLQWAADWAGPGEPMHPEGHPRPAAEAAPASWRVLLDETWRATPPQMLGWLPPSPRKPGPAAQLIGPRGPRCGGRIVPALAGAALAIDS